MTIGQFLRSLEEFSILSEDALRALRDESAALGAGAMDVKAFAARLVADGKLTRFQSKTIYHGKARRLICGEYVLLERLNAGGMGKAYRAVQRGSDAIVGIKVIASRSLQSQQAVREFQRDVDTAARLKHPNIVATYEVGVARGLPYLVIECVEGTTLSKLVKKQGPLAVELAVQYLADVARGLEYAHAEHVVHRDIRPANLLLTPGGSVKVLDLGLARPERPLVEPLSGESRTDQGEIARDIDFMAPEQAADLARVDRRSDIYSLGCTLFYLLTGQRIFRGQSVLERLLAHRDAPIPSLQTLRTDVPLALELVFQRLVAKQPERRYQTMAAVREALEQCLNPELALPPVVSGVDSAPALPSLPLLSAPPSISTSPPVLIPPPIQTSPSRPVTPDVLAPPPFPVGNTTPPQYPTGPPPTDDDELPWEPWWESDSVMPVAIGLAGVALLVLIALYASKTNSSEPGDAGKPSQVAQSELEVESVAPATPPALMNTEIERVPSRPAELIAVNRPVITPPEAQASMKPPSPLSVKPAPSPPPPVTATDGKLAVPAAEALNLAIAQVRETYQSDFEKAQTPWRKAELAKELVEHVNKLRKTPEKQYAMLHLARRLAIEAGDADMACQAIDALGARFEIDILAAKTDALTAAARQLQTLSTADRNVLADELLERASEVAGQTLAAGRYELARTLADQMLKASKTLLDATFARPWSDLARRIDEQQKFYTDRFVPALDKIHQNVDDGVAQADVGCFYCFYQGDWDRGLPHLQRSAIATWQRLAEQELKGPLSVDDRLLLAAGWWEVASSSQPFANQQIKLHAARWYQRASVRMLAGDTRDAVEAKLREMRLDANSEAVVSGIRWLIERQLDDGSWTFKSEPNAGSFNNQVAATAMALRVLLEANLGDNKSLAAVRKGLEFVRRRGKDGDYRSITEPQSNMYVQAVATIALCEGYTYTKDSKLKKEAQQAVQFILAAQDPNGGGWRYAPLDSPGDLASTGWQVTALDIAKRAGIDANYPASFRGVGYFLSTVTSDDGISYFYNQASTTPNRRLTTVGLVCRTLLRSRFFDPKNASSRATMNAARRIVEEGPSTSDAYFNYYATQLLRMKGDDDWRLWRQQMANVLLNSQEKDEGVAGSWFTGWAGSDADPGGKLLPDNSGRLGITALCLVTLLDCTSH